MWQRFVALGDSVTEGIGDPVDGVALRGWTDHLLERLQERNAGIRHWNLARRGLLAAEIRDQQLERALALQPDLVSLTAGGNDLLKGRWDPVGVGGVLEEMTGRLAGTGATLITVTLPDFPALLQLPAEAQSRIRTQLLELNSLIRATAKRHGALCADLWHHPMTLDPATWSRDGIHPNAVGYRELAGEIGGLIMREAATQSAG